MRKPKYYVRLADEASDGLSSCDDLVLLRKAAPRFLSKILEELRRVASGHARRDPLGAQRLIRKVIVPLLLSDSHVELVRDVFQGYPVLLSAAFSALEQNGVATELLTFSSPDPSSAVASVCFSGHVPDVADGKLDKPQFATVAVSSADQLRACCGGTPNICAFLFGAGSVLHEAGDWEEQREIIRAIAEYSSTAVIRVFGTETLLSLRDATDAARDGRCRTRSTDEHVYFSPTECLTEDEYDLIEDSALRLAASAEAHLVSAELDANERQTLMLALAGNYGFGRSVGDVHLDTIGISAVHGGRTSAKVVHAKCLDRPYSVIAKIGSVVVIRDEIERLSHFIVPLDREVRSDATFHAGVGVLLVELIESGGPELGPAPTLEALLQEIWTAELFACEDGEGVNLPRFISRVAKKLSVFNRTRIQGLPTSAREFPSYATLHRKGSRVLSSMDWGFGAQIHGVLSAAEEIYRRLDKLAVVHGDVNLRNIVIRAGVEPVLIDFACAGPGHPGFDLVRLEVALFVQWFQAVGSERECIQFQHAFNQGLGPEELKARFSELHGLNLNQAIVCCLAHLRDEALTTLSLYGGSRSDYLAVKILAGWWALALVNCQTSLARAIVQGVAIEFDEGGIFEH